jgi:hypothetical protein
MSFVRRLFVLTAGFVLTTNSWAQGTGYGAPSPQPNQEVVASDTTSAPVSQAEFDALQRALAAQQKQIEQLNAQLAFLMRKLGEPVSQPPSAKPAGAPATEAALTMPHGSLVTAAVTQGNDPEERANSTEPASSTSELEGPLTIRFRGLNITPGGFLAAETVRRSRALAADVSTPFNSVPAPGASQGKISEFFGTARQTRPTVYFSGHLHHAELSSYLSGDFLSAGTTSTSNSTNGYTYRLRQAWGQAQFNRGWSVVGGQMWSLVTENLYGIRPSDDSGKSNDARPKTIDSAYNIGFSYTRQFGIRLAKNFGDKIWLAFAAENPQATLATHNNAANFLLGQPGDGKSYNPQATYSFNPSPDLIAKVAFDPGFGHYEIFALYDRFTDRVFPCAEIGATALCGGSATAGPNALGARNATTNGSGFGANARWNFDHHRIVFGLHGFGGNGVGRYGTGGLPDLAINADGTPRLIKGYQGLTTLEWHGKKLFVYLYGGAEYAGRTFEVDPLSHKQVGYGAPSFDNTGCFAEVLPTGSTGFVPGSLAHCTGDTRVLIEGTGGFWYRFYEGPAGRVQFGTQYSYVTRETWSGLGGEPHGIDNMVFTSLRYYLP